MYIDYDVSNLFVLYSFFHSIDTKRENILASNRNLVIQYKDSASLKFNNIPKEATFKQHITSIVSQKFRFSAEINILGRNFII